MSKWKKVALWKKILIGVVIGLIIGLVSPKAAEVISPLGDIFLRMLKMLIVPLVFFSITSGVCKMGDVKQLRTVGIRYVLWIIASAVIAAICGVIGGLIVQPGRGTTEFSPPPRRRRHSLTASLTTSSAGSPRTLWSPWPMPTCCRSSCSACFGRCAARSGR